MSRLSLLLLTITVARVLALATQAPFTIAHAPMECPLDSVASCTNSTPIDNLCCFESPGGLLLQTQFWDSDPPKGPVDSWTIHSLWPDNCDLTYASNCDPSRAYKNISGLLSSQGARNTLDYMNEAISGRFTYSWADHDHEWSKHGTCYRLVCFIFTLKTTCLPKGSPDGAEAVAYFRAVVDLFKTLPTYQWLLKHNILPSVTTSYTLEQLQAALRAETGFTPALYCKGSGVATRLSSIGWYFLLRGSLMGGELIFVDAPERGRCPNAGIKYPLKVY
ncbi:ribonuclease T2 [Mycena amicta]|nr:ribonuclease T2 [Mycena amicta]